MNPGPPRPLYCHFCGANDREVTTFITGSGSAICPDCARAGLAAIEAAARREREPAGGAPSTPRRMVELLDRMVVAQDAAKRSLSVAVHNHAKRVGAPDGVVAGVPKSNVLMVGPSGSGKTLLADVLARSLGLPLVVVDVTSITQAGYVGEDVESIFTRLLLAADGDLERAQRGIVFLDEIDKLARAGGGGGPDVGGAGVQQALLKIMEGTSVSLERRGAEAAPARGTPRFDTTDVLFIAGGAFVGLADPAADGPALGFGSPRPRAGRPGRGDVPPQDLVAFGMLPELVGRFAVTLRLHPLDVDALVRVLVEPQDCLVERYRQIFRLDGHELDLTPEALRAVAERAAALGTGARGLRAVMEATLRDLMFDSPERAPGARFTITAADVELGWDGPPQLVLTTASPAPTVSPPEAAGRSASTDPWTNRRSAR